MDTGLDASSSDAARSGVGHNKRPRLLAFLCMLCDVRANDETSWQAHLQSRRHRTAVERGTRDSEPIDRRRRPVQRRPDMSATAQLTLIDSHTWASFAAETVRALFLLRTQRHYFLKDSQRLGFAKTLEEFAALLLNAPRLITAAVPLARARLACTNLPESSPHPQVVLAPHHRHQLRQECLFRGFQRTVLVDSPKLMSFAATRALEDGMAPALLEDDPFGNLFHEYAQVIWCGCSDRLGEHACPCAPRAADLVQMRADVLAQQREFAAWDSNAIDSEPSPNFGVEDLDLNPQPYPTVFFQWVEIE